ncbi:GntR family transcriptional regulator [Lewinellaceae bacterium SD302]|nr:GntR family transcriptional regulator [Lewinellaceae bacterium SD302]
MDFKEPTAIYQQIADYGLDQVLTGNWSANERIPSVRKLAGEVGVNPNTVMRAFDFLDREGIIYNERGKGFFVSTDGKAKAQSIRRQQFINTTLPQLAHELELLDISHDELLALLNNPA